MEKNDLHTSMRFDGKLVRIIKANGEGNNFTEKLHNYVYKCAESEKELKENIKALEIEEKILKDNLKDLCSKYNNILIIFGTFGSLLKSVSNEVKWNYENSLEKITNEIRNFES